MSGTDYDAANEMTALEGYGLTYDDNGNLVSKVDASGTTTYTWDARNRLTDISGPSLTASFDYDALGRRISRTVNGTTTSFIYDGWDIIQDTTGGVTTDYTRTLNIDEPLAYYRSNGTVRYYVADALGSVTALTDANGIVTTSYKYDEFGKVTITGSDYNAFQYTGRENDGTGLYYYRARYYSPEMRRFISEDPIRLNSGINFYEYVKNNPMKWKDSTGLEITRDLGVKNCPPGMKRVLTYERFKYSRVSQDFLDLMDALLLLKDASFSIPVPNNWEYDSLIRYWSCVSDCYELKHTGNKYRTGKFAIWEILEIEVFLDYGSHNECCGGEK
jgi:RHS repeat-associated protein